MLVGHAFPMPWAWERSALGTGRCRSQMQRDGENSHLRPGLILQAGVKAARRILKGGAGEASREVCPRTVNLACGLAGPSSPLRG